MLVFFLPTCPHCHQMLKYLDALAKQLDNKELAIVPVSIDDKKYVIEEMVSDLKISLVPYSIAATRPRRRTASRPACPRSS